MTSEMQACRWSQPSPVDTPHQYSSPSGLN